MPSGPLMKPAHNSPVFADVGSTLKYHKNSQDCIGSWVLDNKGYYFQITPKFLFSDFQSSSPPRPIFFFSDQFNLVTQLHFLAKRLKNEINCISLIYKSLLGKEVLVSNTKFIVVNQYIFFLIKWILLNSPFIKWSKDKISSVDISFKNDFMEEDYVDQVYFMIKQFDPFCVGIPEEKVGQVIKYLGLSEEIEKIFESLILRRDVFYFAGFIGIRPSIAFQVLAKTANITENTLIEKIMSFLFAVKRPASFSKICRKFHLNVEEEIEAMFILKRFPMIFQTNHQTYFTIDPSLTLFFFDHLIPHDIKSVFSLLIDKYFPIKEIYSKAISHSTRNESITSNKSNFSVSNKIVAANSTKLNHEIVVPQPNISIYGMTTLFGTCWEPPRIITQNTKSFNLCSKVLSANKLSLPSEVSFSSQLSGWKDEVKNFIQTSPYLTKHLLCPESFGQIISKFSKVPQSKILNFAFYQLGLKTRK